MRKEQTPKRTSRVLQSIKRLPLFHRILLIMLCLVLLMLLGIHLSGRLFRKSLTDNYLELAQNKLEQNVQDLGDSIYSISAIPQAVEDSQYFKYVRKEKSGTLPTKSLPALAQLQKSLRNQFYLQGENIECLLYFSGSNCIVSRNGSYRFAEDFFINNIHISEEEQARLLDYLNTSNTRKLFPLQNVTNNYIDYGPCWVYTVRSSGTSTAVAAFYPVSHVVDSLGISSLPAETLLTVDSLDGERLATYPAESEHYDSRDYHSISAQDSRLSCKFTLYIPNAYFEEQMQQVTQNSLLITALIVALGIIFSFVMSRMSSKPIQNLLESHGHQRTALQGEEEVLDQILTRSKQVQQEMHESLFANLLAKLFSGAILSETEMKQFSNYTASLRWPCLAAVIYTNDESILPQLCHHIRTAMGVETFCQTISTSQIGLLMCSDPQKLSTLENTINGLLQEYPRADIRCGVSDNCSEQEQLHVAVQHAKMALSRESCFETYTSDDADAKTSFSWIQHERLYQSILNDDQQNAMDLLQQIAREPYQGTAAWETYCSILFILRNAASALNVPLEELYTITYDHARPPWDNFGQLESLLKLLFERVQLEKEKRQQARKQRILEYIDRNFSDCNLCAASIADAFKLSDKQIYRIVREMTDMSLSEYLLVNRMRKASELLCTTSISPGEIAIQCGYPAESTFYRVFKAYFGVAPGKYRQNQ